METQSQTVNNAIKLVGEYFAPGASLLIDGKILPGTGHLIAGLLLRTAIGPIGYGLVIANPYSSSTTGKNLLKHFIREKKVESADTSEEMPIETVEAVVQS